MFTGFEQTGPDVLFFNPTAFRIHVSTSLCSALFRQLLSCAPPQYFQIIWSDFAERSSEALRSLLLHKHPLTSAGNARLGSVFKSSCLGSLQNSCGSSVFAVFVSLITYRFFFFFFFKSQTHISGAVRLFNDPRK